MGKNRSKAKKPGRKTKPLKSEGVDWQDALKLALGRPKPEKGWESEKEKEPTEDSE